jgi:hypothetical protein
LILSSLTMKRFGCYFFLLFFLIVSSQSVAKEKKHIGWVENVRIFPSELQFKAKMDTGAYNSSINAKNIEEFERDGENWVRFDVLNKNKVSTTLELPVVKEVTIKQHFGERQKRYAVKLGVCLGKTYKETQVSLVDREGFLYAMLIGRNFLRGNFVVDPAEQFTSSPRCQVPDRNQNE